MRIDEIDLFGPILVNGSTGSEGQVLGFSGSSLTWITPVSSGVGSAGPLGPTGGGINIPINQIAIGDGGGGLTSSSFLKIVGTNNFLHGSASVTGNNNTIIGSHELVGVSQQNSMSGSYNSIFGGSLLSSSAQSCFTFLAGGYNSAGTEKYNSILGGIGNSMNDLSYNYLCWNTLIVGCCNCIQTTGDFLLNSSIIGGYSNQINNISTTVCFSTIISSENSIIKNSYISANPRASKFNSIIGGDNNIIDYGSNTELSAYNSIISGSNNCVGTSTKQCGPSGDIFQAYNSTIISSKGSIIRSARSVMIGTYNQTLELWNCCELTISPYLETRKDHVMIGCGRIGNYSMFNGYTNTNECFKPGTFFNSTNAKNNCFVVYCGNFPNPSGGKKLTILV